MFKIEHMILAIPLIACGCHDDGDAYTKDSLQAEFVILDKFGQGANEFTVGEEITFEIKVTNTENFPLDYSVTLPGYDIEITQGDAAIWSANYGISSAQVISTIGMDALEEKVISVKWNGLNNEGNVVSSGSYLVSPVISYFVKNEKIDAPLSKNFMLN